MNKQLCNKLTKLLGHKSWQKIGHPCTGKWRGTTDYSLLFEDETHVFISNGMKYFDECLAEMVDTLERFISPSFQTEFMEILNRQREVDDKVAASEGLHSYKILGFAYKQVFFGIHYGLKLEVDGTVFNFMETGFVMDMQDTQVDAKTLLNKWQTKRRFTAGAVEKPTFIFHNVRYSHLDKLYKF